MPLDDRRTVEPQPGTTDNMGMRGRPDDRAAPPEKSPAQQPAEPAPRPREIGGPKGPEPTRYGDWEVGGRCTDF